MSRKRKTALTLVLLIVAATFVSCLVFESAFFINPAYASEPDGNTVVITMVVKPGIRMYLMGDQKVISTENGSNTVEVPVTIIDTTGSGDGWSLSIDSQSVTVTGYQIEAGGSSSQPVTSLSYPVIHTGVIMNAGRDSGMGVTKVILTMQIPRQMPTIGLSIASGLG